MASVSQLTNCSGLLVVIYRVPTYFVLVSFKDEGVEQLDGVKEIRSHAATNGGASFAPHPLLKWMQCVEVR